MHLDQLFVDVRRALFRLPEESRRPRADQALFGLLDPLVRLARILARTPQATASEIDQVLPDLLLALIVWLGVHGEQSAEHHLTPIRQHLLVLPPRPPAPARAHLVEALRTLSRLERFQPWCHTDPIHRLGATLVLSAAQLAHTLAEQQGTDLMTPAKPPLQKADLAELLQIHQHRLIELRNLFLAVTKPNDPLRLKLFLLILRRPGVSTPELTAALARSGKLPNALIRFRSLGLIGRTRQADERFYRYHVAPGRGMALAQLLLGPQTPTPATPSLLPPVRFHQLTAFGGSL